MVSLKRYKTEALVAIAYLIIALVFFWPLLYGRLPGSGDSAYQSAWKLWWVSYSIFVLHTSPYHTSFVLFPVGANLITQTIAPLAGIIAAPFQALGSAAALSFIFFVGFVLSGLFAYLLIFYLTKDKLASFLGGFIFAFSPIHVVQALGHLQYTNIEFLPLFLLGLLLLIEKKQHKHAVLVAVSFVFLTFMGDIEQALMAVVLAFLVIVYMLLRKEERSKLNARFWAMLAEAIVLAFIFGSPGFLSIAHGLSNETLATVNMQASTAYNELYSPDLLSFFVPSPSNGLLHSLPESVANIYKGDVAETTAYVGYSVLLVVAYALYADYKKNKLKTTGLFAFIAFFFLWLSIGPYLQVDGTITGLPGIYLLYHSIPYFNVLREPGRFNIVSELMLAVIFAYGFSWLRKSTSLRKEDKQYLLAFIVALLFIEYFAMPIGSKMLNSEFSSSYVPKAYYELARLPGRFSVLLLPALTDYANATAPNEYPGMALYYQTIFKKPLVGGYATRENATQLFSLFNIPLVVSAYYLQEGQGLVYLSPLITNYTNATKFLLAAYNVTFVGVMRSAYTLSELENITSYLASMFGYPIYESNTTIIFSTANALRTAGTYLAAYTPVLVGGYGSVASTWQPGWLLCQYYHALCNSTFSTMWWAANPAFVEIFAPKTENLSISLQAMSLSSISVENVYFDGTQVDRLTLQPFVRNYTINVTAIRGINSLVFAPSTGEQQLGARNITIAVR